MLPGEIVTEIIEASGAETMSAMRRFVGTLRGDGAAPLAPTGTANAVDGGYLAR